MNFKKIADTSLSKQRKQISAELKKDDQKVRSMYRIQLVSKKPQDNL